MTPLFEWKYPNGWTCHVLRDQLGNVGALMLKERYQLWTSPYPSLAAFVGDYAVPNPVLFPEEALAALWPLVAEERTVWALHPYQETDEARPAETTN